MAASAGPKCVEQTCADSYAPVWGPFLMMMMMMMMNADVLLKNKQTSKLR